MPTIDRILRRFLGRSNGAAAPPSVPFDEGQFALERAIRWQQTGYKDAGYEPPPPQAQQPQAPDVTETEQGPDGVFAAIGTFARSAQQFLTAPAPAPAQALATKATAVERKTVGEVPIINDGGTNAPSVTVRYSTGMPTANWSGPGYESLAESGYRRNSDVFACVTLIAQSGKQVKWADGTSGSKTLTDPEVLLKAIGVDRKGWPSSTRDDPATLRKQLNPRPSIDLLNKAGGPAFIENWLSYMLLSGNAYIEVVRTGATISMVYLNNPATMTAVGNKGAIRAADAIAQWRVTTPHGQRRILLPWEKPKDGDIVQSKFFNPLDPIYGMAPAAAAMLKVDWQNEGAVLAKRILQRGFSPGWIEAKPESEWDDVQVAKVKQRIKESKAAGEELFLENAVWHDMGFSLGESGIIEQQLLNKRDIASVFHVDPTLIGDTTNRTYATYAQSRLALYMEAVVPHLTQFRDDWNRTIGAELHSPLDFDKDAFDAITAARQEAADRVQKLFTSGLITQNEGRADLEYDQVRDGNQFFAPASLLPLGSGTEPDDEDE